MPVKPARNLSPGDHVHAGDGKYTVVLVEPRKGIDPRCVLKTAGAVVTDVVLVHWHPVGRPGCVYRQPVDADYDVSLLDACDPDLREPESRERSLRSLFSRM